MTTETRQPTALEDALELRIRAAWNFLQWMHERDYYAHPSIAYAAAELWKALEAIAAARRAS